MRFGEQAPPSNKIVAWIEDLRNGSNAPYDTNDNDLYAALRREFLNKKTEKDMGRRPRLHSSVAPVTMQKSIFSNLKIHLSQVPRSAPIAIPRVESCSSLNLN